MVDISLCCSAAVCSVKKTCRRNPDNHKPTAISDWQSWFSPVLDEITETGCSHYIPLKKLSENVPDRKKRRVVDQLADRSLWLT